MYFLNNDQFKKRKRSQLVHSAERLVLSCLSQVIIVFFVQATSHQFHEAKKHFIHNIKSPVTVDKLPIVTLILLHLKK